MPKKRTIDSLDSLPRRSTRTATTAKAKTTMNNKDEKGSKSNTIESKTNENERSKPSSSNQNNKDDEKKNSNNKSTKRLKEDDKDLKNSNDKDNSLSPLSELSSELSNEEEKEEEEEEKNNNNNNKRVKKNDDEHEVKEVENKNEEGSVEKDKKKINNSNSNSNKKLVVGDVLDVEIVLKDQDDKEVEILKVLKDGNHEGVIFFIYPRANTPGCTTQACGYRDLFEEIKEIGFLVFGLSMDSPKSQKNWKVKQKLPYNLLCDPKQSLIKLLGGSKSVSQVKRSHYIFDKDLKLLSVDLNASTKNSPKEALEFIRSISKKKN